MVGGDLRRGIGLVPQYCARKLAKDGNLGVQRVASGIVGYPGGGAVLRRARVVADEGCALARRNLSGENAAAQSGTEAGAEEIDAGRIDRAVITDRAGLASQGGIGRQGGDGILRAEARGIEAKIDVRDAGV